MSMREGLTLAKDFPYLHHIIPDATIATTTNYDDFGNIESCDYAWEGDKNGIVGISFVLFKRAKCSSKNGLKIDGNVILVGPYRLRVIGRDYNALYAVRDGWQAAIKVRQMKIVCLLNKIYRRLIITCSVWGLADYNEAVIPTWRDVHALKRITKWIKK